MEEGKKSFISDAKARCPSLRGHKNRNIFLLILVFHGLCPSENDALIRWTMSRDGQNLYHSLMNTFSSTKEVAEYLLILAVFLCVPQYWELSSTHGPHQPPNDPLPDLGNFVEWQGPADRRMILKETAFAAVRVLTDEKFNRWFEDPRQTEHKYLATVLTNAVSKSQLLSRCLKGPLDRYCKARIAGPVGHAEAFGISLVLTKHLPRGYSCTTSSTTEGSICDKTSGSCKALKTPNKQITIRLVGKRGVGKTEIINRAVNGCFVNEYNPTVDHKRHSKTLRVGGRTCKLDIFDTEGQDVCPTPELMHMESKDVFVLVYDITSRQSFQDISSIFHAREQPQNIIIMLVGNKTDLGEQRLVQQSEGVGLARKLGAHFWEVSALTGGNVNEMFQSTASLVLDQQYSDSGGATEANAGESREETLPEGFWKNLAFVFQSCMGRA